MGEKGEQGARGNRGPRGEPVGDRDVGKADPPDARFIKFVEIFMLLKNKEKNLFSGSLKVFLFNLLN